MVRQQFAEKITDEAEAEPARTLPNWQVVARHWVGRAMERVVGECCLANPGQAALIMGVILALLTVIALTLSIGNAVLVAVVGITMRVACEWQGKATRKQREK